MRKHSVRDSLKSFFGAHLHPGNVELLKGTKTEIDEKVQKILEIVDSEDILEDESKRVVVAVLVKEFYREYESLYHQYDDLTGHIRKKVHGKNESSSSSSSDSDSDKRNDRIEAANLEISNLRRKLETTIEDKEAVESEHQETLMKLKESEEILENLRFETEKLASENKELNQKLEDSVQRDFNLNQKLEDMKKEKDELETELTKKFQEVSEMAKMAEENNNLLDQINDVQTALLEQEAAYKTLSQEHNILSEEGEAKIKKLTDDYKQAQEMIEELQAVTSTMENLSNEVEIKEEEIQSLMEKLNNIEVKLRLTNQKLRITEQVLREKEEETKRIETNHTEKIAIIHESYKGIIKEISEKVNSTILNRFETLSEKIEEKYRSFEVTVVEAAKMILTAIEMKKKMEKTLEGKVREEEKLKERLLELGEEKREAIRQLCVWIDYHSDRSEYLQEVLSKLVMARRQRQT